MATFEKSERFQRDFNQLSGAAQDRFRACVVRFNAAVDGGPPYPSGLRIKKVQGTSDVWELTWAPDGRATFEFGGRIPAGAGAPHVVWRRVGGHDIFNRP